MAFKTEFYEIVREAVPVELLKFLNLELELLKKIKYIKDSVDESDTNFFRDDLCKNSFPMYGSACTEALGLYLHPKIEEVTGKTLYPTYTYMRIYYTGSEMMRHKDRSSCEYSATICISNDPVPWALHLEDLKGVEKIIYLNPGDMLVYKGEILRHWREEYKGNRQAQVFTHYVDTNGAYKNHIYDRRPYLGFPADSRKFKVNHTPVLNSPHMDYTIKATENQ
jgi:hypothetical protein